MGPLAQSCFISALGLGTLTTMSSHHWLLAWMGLEINTLAIIPLLASNHHPRAVEAATKYFLTQAAAAALILFSSINNAWITGEWDITNLTNPASITLMTVALAIKLGLSPFHFWLPDVLQGTPLIWGLILTTWQKLAPMSLMLMLSPNLNSTLFLTVAILSIMVGGWGGLNQTQIRKILAYSSIAHLGWMAAVIPIFPSLALLSLIIYIIMTSSMFLTFLILHTTAVPSLASAWPKTPIIIVLVSLTLLSMGGLPPLTGFLPKLLILTELIKQNTIVLPLMMAISALLSLFFYVRLLYSLSLTIYPNATISSTWWRAKPQTNTIIMSTFLIFSSSLLPLSPSIINLF
uniref:NADH-ubiquinone oxidoreductase chain 2 n=1 Tax=Leptobrachium leishanense TaxID=445787 RepID=A0A342YVJ4_9ANUR|nr:NADH dehydrogenase subunit 2 [Leptobrachium leishanense]AOS53024.1 NADH dehydrogenase subunit 2 [Leptobrachium leishanense]